MKKIDTGEAGPLLLTVSETAKRLGLNRSTVAGLCHRGEIAYIPAIRPDGSRSRIHKRVIWSSVEAWVAKNAVHCPEDLKKAVDGRRRGWGPQAGP